jgi:hypothetical protein
LIVVCQKVWQGFTQALLPDFPIYKTFQGFFVVADSAGLYFIKLWTVDLKAVESLLPMVCFKWLIFDHIQINIQPLQLVNSCPKKFMVGMNIIKSRSNFLMARESVRKGQISRFSKIHVKMLNHRLTETVLKK